MFIFDEIKQQIMFNFHCVLSACDPKLMPTFPQHRNIKGAKTAQTQEGNVNTGAGDQTNNLPAISDLVKSSLLSLIDC